jgi:hypothetical protein
MESKAILDKLLEERVVGLDIEPNTPRRLDKFTLEVLQLSQKEIAVLIRHYADQLRVLCDRCGPLGNSEEFWYLAYDGNVIQERIKRLIAELDRRLENMVAPRYQSHEQMEQASSSTGFTRTS